MADGKLITFEGIDGAGKSTHIKFLCDVLKTFKFDVELVREPGSVEISEKIRSIVLDPSNINMTANCELLLYCAARSQVISEVIKPAIENGKIVLCDRFIDSTIAYQGCGRGINIEIIKKLNDFVLEGIKIDATVVFLSDKSDRAKRLERRDGLDRLEMSDDAFKSRVESAFYNMRNLQDSRIRVVDSSGLHSKTALSVLDSLSDVIKIDKESKELQTMLKDFDLSHDHSND